MVSILDALTAVSTSERTLLALVIWILLVVEYRYFWISLVKVQISFIPERTVLYIDVMT